MLPSHLLPAPGRIAAHPGALTTAIIIIAALCAGAAHAQDVVTTYGGDRYLGTITQVSHDSVTIVARNDVDITIHRGIVSDMETMRSSWPSLGISVITPGGINLVAGYDFDGPCIRGVLGGIPGQGTWGAQLNAGIRLSHSPTFTQHLSVGVISMNLRSTEHRYFGPDIEVMKEWNGIGVFYDFNWRGFFLETGLTAGHGYFSSPQLALQLGYVYQFDLMPWRGR